MKPVSLETKIAGTVFLFTHLLFYILISPVISVSVANAEGRTEVNTSVPRAAVDIYNYFCYQCHAYSGNAQTLASTYLDPKPRNFRLVSRDMMSRQDMIDSVTMGRPGTAMVSFSRLLTATEIAGVVDFVRREFMQANPSDGYYHTAENGWPNHRRYMPAFPFVNGDIALSSPWQQLTDEQRRGRQLYISACVSCHDHARADIKKSVWSLSSLSYPREQYTHEPDEADHTPTPSIFNLHQHSPKFEQLSDKETRGQSIYLNNCAFCHAPDGSGHNWIGSFLVPNPAELTGSRVRLLSEQQLQRVIRQGVEGTSMPAWKHSLDNEEISDVIAYVRRAFQTGDSTFSPMPVHPATSNRNELVWRRLSD